MSGVDNNVIALMVLQEENKQLKNKLEKIGQIVNDKHYSVKALEYEIKEVLEQE